MEQLLLGHEVDGSPQAHADHERVEEAPVVRGQDHRPARGDVLAALALEPEPDPHRGLQDRTHDPVHNPVHAAPPRALVIALLAAGPLFGVVWHI